MIESVTTPFKFTLARLFLAMSHQEDWARSAEARRELDAVRKLLDGLGLHDWRDSSEQELGRGELMSYGWTEWVIATARPQRGRGADRLRPDLPRGPVCPVSDRGARNEWIV